MNQGIYKIHSRRSGCCYVGSSVNLTQRKSNHISELMTGKHDNRQLQNHYNKIDCDLIFEVLEIVDNAIKLAAREQYYIDLLNPLYNKHKAARAKKYDHTKAISNGPLRADNKSGFSGVVYDKASGDWRARVKINGKNLDAGRYRTAIDAVIGRDKYITSNNLPHKLQYS